MEGYVGKICPFCKTEIKEGEAVKVCPSCDIPHHESCWQENKGCTTFGCSEQHVAEPPAAEAPAAQGAVCSSCGTPLAEDQAFCPKCGAPKFVPAPPAAPEKLVCSNCGTELLEDQAFCPKCGAPKPALTPPAAPFKPVCPNCGTELSADQAFCPKCGTQAPKPPAANRVCAKCGTQLNEGQMFCPKCGQRADLQLDANVNSAINEFNNNLVKKQEKSKKKPIIITVVALVVIAAVVLGIVLIPQLLKKPEDYMKEGNYVKAYDIAKEDEKDDIVAENAVAICSDMCVDALKDSKSFSLREGYYDPSNGYVVLKVSANNSYGNPVINYWLYTYDNDDHEFQYFDSYSDLKEEKYSYWDTTSEKAEKIVNNIGKNRISATMIPKFQVSGEGVERINDLFDEGDLDDVEPLDVKYKSSTD